MPQAPSLRSLARPVGVLLALTALGFGPVAGSLCAQDQGTEKKKFGTVFKSEVDGLVNGLRSAIQTDQTLGDGTALQTAQILTAMGHCHRFYGLSDGPVVRGPVRALFGKRTSDGSFNDAGGDPVEVTRWVIDALEVMDPREYAAEIDSARAWVKAQNAQTAHAASPWQSHLIEWRAQMRQAGTDPKSAGAPIAGRVARGPIRTPDGAIDHAASVAALLDLVACQAIARELDAPTSAPPAFSAAAQRGFDYLLAQQKDGTFFVQTPNGAFPDAGLSGMGLAALQTKPAANRTKAEQATIDKGIAALLAQQNEDGSFGRTTVNYTTCAAILALSMAEDPRHKPALLRARDYILTIQNIEDRGYARGDRDYGSIGYGGDQRGDLSNLGFAIQALRNAELEPSHEAFAKAIVFLQRTQNVAKNNDFEGRRVRDENGDWQIVRSGDDGGAAYYPGNSPAGYDEQPDGSKVPRSYGSMTYMLLRTYILCGLERDDPRIQRAVEWIGANWQLDVNPGSSPLMPDKAKYQGLYYYYMVLAQALDTAGIDPLPVRTVAPDGTVTESTVDWRAELTAALEQRQRADGSWVNDDNGRWWESSPTICTIYALLGLERCAR